MGLFLKQLQSDATLAVVNDSSRSYRKSQLLKQASTTLPTKTWLIHRCLVINTNKFNTANGQHKHSLVSIYD